MQTVYTIRKLVNNNMLNKKNITSYILSIFLILCFIALTILVVIKHYIFNKDNIKQQLISSNYYSELYNTTQDGFNNYILQSGFDNTILDNIITIPSITNDVNNLIDSLFAGSNITTSSDTIKNTLHTNIENYISENNFIINNETSENIKRFEDSIINVYTNNVIYSQDIVNKIASFIPRIQTFLNIGIIVLVILSIILVILIWILNKASIGISLLSSGLLLILSHFYSNINIAINNILILNKPFSTFISNLLNTVLNSLLILGITYSLIGIVIILLKSSYSKKNKA